MSFQRVHTGTRWEQEVGYCRAVKAGNLVFVTGSAPVETDGSTHAPGDAYRQTVRCIEIGRKAIEELGGSLANVTRTRLFVTDISRWQEYGRAHGEVFCEHPPATTMVEISKLIEPDMLIEIEFDAVL